jgi:hypothetical protein
VLAVAAPALADNVMTGTHNGFTYEARSLIVGMTPTSSAPGNGVGGGDPRFFASMPKYSGVTALIMDYGVFTSGPNEGLAARFICSGTNMPGGYILTAAHCVRPRAGVSQASPTTSVFFNNSGLDQRVPFNPASTEILVSQINIHPGYTGQVIDHNDIAILKLSEAAPEWAGVHKVSMLNDLRGVEFNVAGYGARSAVGGAVGTGAGQAAQTGWLRQGLNMFDYRMGDPIFSQVPGNGWQTVFATPPTNFEFSYLSDFDSGLALNDTACRVAQASNLAQAAGAVFCDTGRGKREVSVAGGDSGGPQFAGRAMNLLSVTSYGLTFGPAWGDCFAGLNSSCGEFNGFVPLYIHKDWIRGIAGAGALAVPEPATWAMLIAGFGLVGGVARRRRALATARA